jgi:hypothetical protein
VLFFPPSYKAHSLSLLPCVNIEAEATSKFQSFPSKTLNTRPKATNFKNPSN